MKDIPLKRAPTLLLKAVVVLLGIIGLVIGVVLAFSIRGEGIEFNTFAQWIYLALFGLYASAIPFYIALYQTFKLLHYIDKNNPFSEQSAQALRSIKFCGLFVSALWALAMPMVFIFADLDDAPGAVVIGAAFMCAPLVIATFAAVLQRLVQSAVDLKMENDLTI